jgi:hypothetical protein
MWLPRSRSRPVKLCENSIIDGSSVHVANNEAEAYHKEAKEVSNYIIMELVSN